jgi:hypothetical protein
MTNPIRSIVPLGNLPAVQRSSTPAFDDVVVVPGPASSILGSLPKPYTNQSGACWAPGVSPTKDLPCGFTNLGSLLLYFEVGSPIQGYDSVYGMSWVSRHDAVLALSPSGFRGVLYCSVGYASKGWYSLEQLGAEVSPDVQPVVSSAACTANGITYVAIATVNPKGHSTWWSCGFDLFPPYNLPMGGTITEL